MTECHPESPTAAGALPLRVLSAQQRRQAGMSYSQFQKRRLRDVNSHCQGHPAAEEGAWPSVQNLDTQICELSTTGQSTVGGPPKGTRWDPEPDTEWPQPLEGTSVAGSEFPIDWGQTWGVLEGQVQCFCTQEQPQRLQFLSQGQSSTWDAVFPWGHTAHWGCPAFIRATATQINKPNWAILGRWAKEEHRSVGLPGEVQWWCRQPAALAQRSPPTPQAQGCWPPREGWAMARPELSS